MRMIRWDAAILAMVLMLVSAGTVRAGLLSAWRERKKDQEERSLIPPPAEKASRKTPGKTPTPEQIKAGADRLKKKMNWEQPPSKLFSRYAGEWRGNFWSYSTSGKLEQVSQISIEFTPVDKQTMNMTSFSFDLLSKTWVTEETATYHIVGDAIHVDIRRPTGKVSKQIGHYKDEYIFFEAQIDDGVEHFREKVDGKRLLIDGFGIYGSLSGKDRHVFIGRFTKSK